MVTWLRQFEISWISSLLLHLPVISQFDRKWKGIIAVASSISFDCEKTVKKEEKSDHQSPFCFSLPPNWTSHLWQRIENIGVEPVLFFRAQHRICTSLFQFYLHSLVSCHVNVHNMKCTSALHLTFLSCVLSTLNVLFFLAQFLLLPRTPEFSLLI